MRLQAPDQRRRYSPRDLLCLVQATFSRARLYPCYQPTLHPASFGIERWHVLHELAALIGQLMVAILAQPGYVMCQLAQTSVLLLTQ